MNKNKFWPKNKWNCGQRGGFRGSRGGNRGWSGNNRGAPWSQFTCGGGGNRYQNNYSGNIYQWRPKRDTPGKRLSEEDIGVTQYISKHEGFNGIIKSRYSDFQVSEINDKGEIAKLTSKKAPQPPKEEQVSEDEDLLLSKYNLEILPMETWDKINSIAMSKEHESECVEIDVKEVTKEQRTKIHDAVKKAFGESIVGSTVNIDDKKLMRFQKYRKGVRVDNRVKWIWPGEYVHFVVHKENCDTMDAAVRIAERIGVHVKPSMLGYAGTKDRRAKTSQWFSARRIDPRKFVQACRFLKDIHVGNFCFKDTNLKLGMLLGNRFHIALRNVTAPDDFVDAACKHLEEHGFINYYGLQRFGSRFDTPTYNIGLKLLQGNFQEAIDTILQVREGPLEEALRAYADSGAAAAIRLLPRRTSAHSEARLLKALAEAPRDLLGALGKLARNTRLLYLHSYQSLIWNRAVSERIKRFGLKPAVGDIVPLTQVVKEDEFDDEDSDSEENQPDENDEYEPDEPKVVKNRSGKSKVRNNEAVKNKAPTNESVENQAVKKEDVDLDNEMDITDNKNESIDVKGEGNDQSDNTSETATPKKDKKKQKNDNEPKPKIPIKILTQEDVDSGKYTIADIVLPLPGYSIEYPPNMKQFFEEQLKKDGLTLQMRHKIKNYSMSGAYRHMVTRPRDVTWRCVRYSDPFADLIPSDLDLMKNNNITAIIEDGTYKALLLNMTLPASCYATMALRELLKVDTSTDNQALQNNYHRKPAKSKDESNSAGKRNMEIGEKQNTETGDKPKTDSAEKRKMESGEKQNMETGEKPKTESAEKRKMGSGEEQNMEIGEKLETESGEKRKMGSGEEQNMEIGEKMETETGEKRKMGSGEEQNLKIGEKLETESGEKRKMGSGEEQNMEIGEKLETESGEKRKNRTEGEEQNMDIGEKPETENGVKQKIETGEKPKAESGEKRKMESGDDEEDDAKKPKVDE